MSRLHLRPLIIAACALLGSGIIGLRWFDALLLGLIVFVLASVATSLEGGAEDPWAAAPPEEADGARSEVAALTWSFFGRDGRVTEVAVRRLRADATRRLARHRVVIPGGLNARTEGSDIDPEVVARARSLLGERAWATLTAPGGLMPSILDVAHCVDVIEGLGSPDTQVVSDRQTSSPRPRGLEP